MCVGALPACGSMPHMHAWCSWGQEESVRFSRAGVTHDGEPSCGCWELNPGPSLQPPKASFLVTARGRLLQSLVVSQGTPGLLHLRNHRRETSKVRLKDSGMAGCPPCNAGELQGYSLQDAAWERGVESKFESRQR